MWKPVFWTLAMLVLLPIAHAQEVSKDPPEAEQPATPAEQFQAMQQEFTQARVEFSTAYRAAETDEERKKVFDEKYPKPEKFVRRFLKLAQSHSDDPVAVDALVWIVTNGQGGDAVEKAVEVLATDHIDSEKLGPVCQRMMYSDSPSAQKLLREVLEKSPHHEVQAHACFSLARLLKRGGSEKNAEESEKLLERVVKEFDDVKSFRGTLADAAKAELFEVRFLGIGKVAPEIEGEDVDGVAFKLSDYRGKVVVLDFWGNW